MKRFFISMFALGCVVLLPAFSKATLVRSLNLRDLASQSQTIVKAQVVSKQVDDDPESGMLVTYYTLKVLDSIKGATSAGDELIFKQVAQGEHVSGNIVTKQNFYFPEYEKGKTYVFFLPAPHERTGLLAPVGLFQGVFDVIKSNGQEILPQLQARKNVLQRGLTSKKNSNLVRLLQTAATSPTYTNFKNTLESL